MPDDQQGGNGQAPPTPAPTGPAPAATPHAAPHGSDPTGPAPAAATTDLDKIKAELAEARRDAAKYRDELKKRDDANLTAQEKLAKDYAELQAEYATHQTEAQARILRALVKAEAAALGLNPELAARLIDAEDLKFSPSGDPTNLTDVLTKRAQEFGLMAATGTNAANGATPQGSAPNVRPTAGGATNPGRTANGTPRTLEDFARMTPAEYALHRPEYLALLQRQQRRR